MKRKSIAVLLICTLVLMSMSLFAEGSQEGSPATGKEEVKYTFYAMGVQPGVDPFWATVYKGLKAAEEILPVKVIYPGMKDGEVNPTGIANKLETALAARPDGIISGYWFLEASDGLSRRAIDEGIPVLAYNLEDPRPKSERIPYLGYIGMDERVTGEILANATLDKMDIHRAAIGIQYPGSSSLETRARGIEKVLNERGIPYEKLDITPNPATAITVLGAYKQKHPDTNVFFLLGPVGTHPALQLLEERNMKDVVISTFDVSEKTITGIKDGRIILTIAQQPFAQGYMAVEQLYMYLEYGILPPVRTPTGPTLVDENNVEVIEKQLKATGGA